MGIKYDKNTIAKIVSKWNEKPTTTKLFLSQNKDLFPNVTNNRYLSELFIKWRLKGFVLNSYNYNKVNAENKFKNNVSSNNNLKSGTITSDTPLTIEDLYKYHNIDSNKWECTAFNCIANDKTNPKGIKYTSYQVRSTFKKKKIGFDINDIDNLFKKINKKKLPTFKKIKRNKKKSKKLLEISPVDVHLGQLSDIDEVGEGYNEKITSRIFLDTINDIVEQNAIFNYDKILFIVGSDFFNTDTRHQTTSYGTPQNDSVLWRKLFDLGIQLNIQAINMLRQKAPVDVVIIQGNHDFERSYYLGCAIDWYFKKCNNVNVDNSHSIRKYYSFGKVLLGLAHGNKIKVNDLPLIMATEQPLLWANSNYREFQLGHLHHKKEVKFVSVEDTKGTNIRYLKSMAPLDSWHKAMGFVGSAKGIDSFIWDYEKGLDCHIENNLIL